MANLSVMDLFKITLIVMLFFSSGITLIAYALPTESKPYISVYEGFSHNYDLTNVSNEIKSSLDSQTNIPVVEIGAMVFYSGNILLDLLLNFGFALPEMVGFVIWGFTEIFNLDGSIILIVQAFATVSMMITYFVALINMITAIRSGRVV